VNEDLFDKQLDLLEGKSFSGIEKLIFISINEQKNI